MSFTALMHNQALIKKAEKILQDAVSDEHTHIYIKQANGEIVKLKEGFKIIEYSCVPIYKEESEVK